MKRYESRLVRKLVISFTRICHNFNEWSPGLGPCVLAVELLSRLRQDFWADHSHQRRDYGGVFKQTEVWSTNGDEIDRFDVLQETSSVEDTMKVSENCRSNISDDFTLSCIAQLNHRDYSR